MEKVAEVISDLPSDEVEPALANVTRFESSLSSPSKFSESALASVNAEICKLRVAVLGEEQPPGPQPLDARDLLTCVWIEQLRARERAVVQIPTAHRQHFPVGQQRGGMTNPRDVQRTSTAPRLTYRVILFASCDLARIGTAASYQHSTRRQ